MIDFLSKIKVRKSILSRTKYLDLLQDVKIFITINKIKSCLGASGEAAFYKTRYEMCVLVS